MTHDGHTPQLQPGTVLQGRYRIEGLLGAGGTAEVYQMGLILVEMLTGTPVVPMINPMACLIAHGQGNLPLPTLSQSSQPGAPTMLSDTPDKPEGYRPTVLAKGLLQRLVLSATRLQPRVTGFIEWVDGLSVEGLAMLGSGEVDAAHCEPHQQHTPHPADHRRSH